MRIHPTVRAALAGILLLSGHEAGADFLSNLDANAFVSSAALDQDLLLPSLTSTSTSGAVDFIQDTTASGWSSNITGPYFGSALNVNYAGDSTGYSSSGGAITWSSSGTYGTQAWTGSGSATFTSTDLGNITGTYQSTLTIGSNTIVFDSVITGSEDSSGNLSISASGDATATIGTEPPVVIGSLLTVNHSRSDQAYASMVKFHPHGQQVYYTDVDGFDQIQVRVDSPKWNVHYDAHLVPEPASLTLVAIAAPCLYWTSVVRRRRDRR